MRKWFIAVGLIAMAGMAHEASEAYAQMQLRQLMIDKLHASQKMLEAIAKGDFKLIGQQADRLSEIANQAEWMAYNKTPKYELHSNEFRRAAETISRKAKDKNLDGVTLAYFDLTMSCVRCHQYTREVRDASLSVPRSEEAIVFARSRQQP
jgi:cytochrome c556